MIAQRVEAFRPQLGFRIISFADVSYSSELGIVKLNIFGRDLRDDLIVALKGLSVLPNFVIGC